jgi:hypothetical protein
MVVLVEQAMSAGLAMQVLKLMLAVMAARMTAIMAMGSCRREGRSVSSSASLSSSTSQRLFAAM